MIFGLFAKLPSASCVSVAFGEDELLDVTLFNLVKLSCTAIRSLK